jgi:riboflavin synthase
MFTGIIEETGVVERIRPTAKTIELLIRSRRCAIGLKAGDSLAVNGCCLTVARRDARSKHKRLRFDLLQETWKRTNLQFVQVGSRVNLERPLRASGRFDGHFVTGHIDSIGRIMRCEHLGKDYLLEILAPPEVMRYIVMKGSIAVDGISLTVSGVRKKSFCVWIIPHTYAVTVLRERKIGDAVNLEADILGKYAAKFIASRS